MKSQRLKLCHINPAVLFLAVVSTMCASVSAFGQNASENDTRSETKPISTNFNSLLRFTLPPLPAAISTTQQEQAPDRPVARPVPQRTVGLDAGKVVRWTMRDAIAAALENNPDIELERVNVRQTQYDLIAAEGAYDPFSTQGTTFTSNTQPNTRPFSGTQSASLNSKTFAFNFGHQGLVQRTGGSYNVNFNNSRFASNFALFDAQYNPSLQLSFTQPLMRNYKIDINRRQIRIAKKNLDLSDAQFRQRVIEIISRVQQAYWDLAFAIKDEEIQRDAVKLAETQLANNKRQVDVGTLAPIDEVSAASELESRRQQVFASMNAVARAENAIKALTAGNTTDELWQSQIIPVETFEAQPLNLPLSDALKLALDNRPELKQLSFRKEINQTDIDFFRNQTKPQVDLFFSYGINGVGGNPATTVINNVPNCTTPFPVGSSTNPQQVCLGIGFTAVRDAAGNILRYDAGVTQTPYVLSTQRITQSVANQFIGGYGTGLKNLFRNEFRQFTVGVNVTLPWRNRTAQANLGRAIENTRLLDLQARRQMQSIEVEVRNAVQSVETARMRIEAARAARQYAAQQLDGEEKRFQAGLSTTFFVLTRQTQLSQARGQELRAQADYNIAVAELQRVISTTLISNSVDVKPTPSATIEEIKK
jgi:HAE1 family hydrophobic/amphiphilic exporter-1